MLTRSKNVQLILCLLVTIASYFTYFYRYHSPPFLFWDENYHITSAQKYQAGVFFMEPHPPLGKMLIALGEEIFNTNENDTSFVEVDHGRVLPAGFSFEGYRFFPALLAWLSAPLFFLLLLTLSRSPAIAFSVGLFYVFDNAMIVHMRGAMLEGIQLFFMIGTLLFLAIEDRCALSPRRRLLVITAASLFFSACVATKVTGLILSIAFIPLLVRAARSGRTLMRTVLVLAGVFLGLQFAVWQLHFALGRRVVPELQSKGYYRASPEYKEIVNKGAQTNPLNFVRMFRDSLHYTKKYEDGVGKLNLCKPAENGSPPYLWPFGGRSISYRWNRVVDDVIAYLYLQVNPVVWLGGILGILLSAGLLSTSLFAKSPLQSTEEGTARVWIPTYFAMWFFYMLVMLWIPRVMYLYHYFMPLCMSLVLLALTAPYLRVVRELRSSPKVAQGLAAAVASAVIGVFFIYAPLTYAWPISTKRLEQLALFDFWDLRCPKCNLTNNWARPWSDPKDKPIPVMRIGATPSIGGSQEWGEPIQNGTVTRVPIVIGGQSYAKGIGTHARSIIKFPVQTGNFEISGKCGLPDYLKDHEGRPATVIFEIWSDDSKQWESGVMKADGQARSFAVPIIGAATVELRVTDAGDGNENDHAVWMDLAIR